MFNEITKKAIQEAIKHPGVLDEKMVAAQRARRVLDRLVGYKLSPLLWDKVRRGLSAGRVQSVALKLVTAREREIEKFVPEEYWHLFARLAGPQPPEFDAKLVKQHGNTIRVANEEQSKAILADPERVVDRSSVATKERKRHAPPPFITSKLQQTARFPVKKTMMLAQQLYEGIELGGLGVDEPIGLITYMRTDSVRVADEALTAVREHIKSTFGAESLPEKANSYKSKADAQDAHEAIRPTSMQYDPETVRPYLSQDQYSLYRLIWNRFVASQMNPATFDDTTVDVTAGDYLFRVKGTVPKFAGWMATYGSARGPSESEPGSSAAGRDMSGGEPGPGGADLTVDADDDATSGVLRVLAEGDRLELKALRPEQKFTQPPPRFTEATLVKELEENGIGRPSTYASIIGVLQDRDYVSKVDGKFRPTALGVIIIDLLVKSFEDILDVDTRNLEEDLDNIEQGKTNYVKTLHEFYKKFKKDPPARARRCRTSRKASRPMDLRPMRPPMHQGEFGRSSPAADTRVHEHARARETGESENGRNPKSSCARTAASRWWSSEGASASFWPAPDTPSAGRRESSSRPSRAGSRRRSPIRFSTRNARDVDSISSSSRDASASSPRARSIPSASTSSTRRPA